MTNCFPWKGKLITRKHIHEAVLRVEGWYRITVTLKRGEKEPKIQVWQNPQTSLTMTEWLFLNIEAEQEINFALERMQFND